MGPRLHLGVRSATADRAHAWARWPATVGVAVYGGLVTATTLAGAIGLLPRWPGLLHLVALPPLDLFADLRWLLARAPNHALFVVGLLASLTIRTTVLALLLTDEEGPRWRLAATLYALALPFALVAGQAGFVAHAVLYSRLFGAGALLTVAVVVLLAAAPWTGATDLRGALARSARTGLRIADVGVYGLALAALGMLASAGGAGASVALVPVGGLLTLLVASRLRGTPPRRPLLHLAGGVLVTAAVVAAIVGTRGASWTGTDEVRDGSLVLMSGINSASGEGAIFELRPDRLGFGCEQTFYVSYAGPGDGQPRGDATCPITTGAPYRPEQTQRPFADQVEVLAAQVDGLPEPVVLMAHSQAAWVAWQAAADGRLTGVRHLVLLGPFPQSPLAFPEPGRDGAGRVGGDLFRAMGPVLDVADFDFLVDAPLTHELLAAPDAATAVFDQPLPDHLAVVAVPAFPDVALAPDEWRVPGATNTCPLREAHPYLPITPALYRVVDDALGDRPVPAGTCGVVADRYRDLLRPLGPPPADR